MLSLKKMTMVIMPKELSETKGLVAVPKNTYKEFLAWQKKTKSVKTFKPTLSDIKSLDRARKNFVKGNYITLQKFKDELAGNSR